MSSDTVARIGKLLGDPALDRAAKIAKLRQWEADALARQRAGTEGMTPASPRASAQEGDDLKQIETALRSLGEDAIDQGPASL